MTTSNQHRRDIQRALLTDDIFPEELAGFAAAAAAADLIDSWEDCDPPLSLEQRLADVRDVIAELQRWMVTL